jgi:poly(hydroxyalkanoate) granule-associated protein
MATNRSRKGAGASDNVAQAMRDSAQKIWLAGLGAFERAKSEGPRMFETLVEQGKGLRARASEAADQALKTVREQAGEAQGKWDKLEQVFEDRVSRSLNRLGVLTSREVGDLSRQVDELNRTVREMMRSKPAGGGAKKKAGAKKRKAPAKAPAKKGATRASRARRA